MRKQKLDYNTMAESDVIIDYVHTRHSQGLYTFILTTGLPGTGKSSKDQRLAELIYERLGTGKFKADDIVDSLLDLLRRIRKIKKPGEIIIIEEMSVLFPSRRAMSRDNVDIARVLDTIRKKRVILIANAPLYTSIDSHIRAMANILTETIRINKTQKFVVYKGWKLQTNPGSGKTYKHTFRRGGRDVNRLVTRQPDKDVWTIYEGRKDVFMDKLYARIESDTKEREEKLEKRKHIGPIRNIELTEKEKETYNLFYNKKLNLTQIAEKLGNGVGLISKRLQRVREKVELSKENKKIDIKK